MCDLPKVRNAGRDCCYDDRGRIPVAQIILNNHCRVHTADNSTRLIAEVNIVYFPAFILGKDMMIHDKTSFAFVV